MKIGIMADSHDHLDNMKKAVSLFNKEKVDYVVHCGDFVAPFAINPLLDLKCRYVGVFGNNDGERTGLINASKHKIYEAPHTIEIMHKKKLTIVHYPYMVLDACENADIVCYGHSHKPEVRHEEKTLVINPGECCGWLTGIATVAILDVSKMRAEVIELK